MVSKEPKQSPQYSKRSPPKQSGDGDCVFSPGFRSVAAMAGWDEEALLIASLVVEDTPDRDAKQKKRSDLQFKTPPSNSRRKRRAQRKSPASIPMVTLNLDEEDDTSKQEITKDKEEPNIDEIVAEITKIKEDPKIEIVDCSKSGDSDSCSKTSVIPCMDRLREELSCAICLEICFEPSTTSCGHSFCKKCLRSAADKCGKRCPKCRQLISNGRSCTVNTVLWNTIQLLFPQEVEARKAAGALNSREASHRSPAIIARGSRYRTIEALNSPEGDQLSLERRRNRILRNPSIQPYYGVSSNRGAVDVNVRRRRRREREVVPPSQDEDAALALRLQREEFIGAFRGGSEEQQQQHRNSSVMFATANLRAMASRAINVRIRGRPT